MTGCHEIREELSAYLDGELAPAAQDEVREHLAACEACRSEHAGLVEVSLATEALPRLEAPPHFTAQVMARVLEEPALSASPTAPRAASGRNPAQRSAAQRPTTGRAASGRLAPPPPAEPPLPSGCVPDEDLSALLDEALAEADATRARGHLSQCARCRDVHAGFVQVRERVLGLPRLEAPPGFAAAVLERIEAWEREETRREQLARVARARWWGHASWAAQAAGFLLLIGVGAALSTPERRPLAWGGHSQAPGRRGWEEGRTRASDLGTRAGEQEDPPLPGNTDARVELLATSLESAREAARAVIAQHGSLEAQRETPRSWSCVVSVPANRADDLLHGLVAARELEGGREVEEVVSRVSTELDRVELRSGHVLVGQASPAKGGGVVLRLGSLSQEVSPRDLLRVERAHDLRRLRIEVRARE